MQDTYWNPWTDCTPTQQQQLEAFQRQLQDLNRHINLISREQTEEQVMERHLVHSLTLSRHHFPPHSVIADWGTGGGLPAIPLAIRFPQVTVYAVDAVGKKVQAVQTIARRLGLTNLHPWHGRAEHFPHAVHYSVSRATAPLKDLWTWHRRVARSATTTITDWPTGLLCLKGGDLADEIRQLQQTDAAVQIETHALYPWLGRPWCVDKVLVTVQGGDCGSNYRT